MKKKLFLVPLFMVFVFCTQAGCGQSTVNNPIKSPNPTISYLISSTPVVTSSSSSSTPDSSPINVATGTIVYGIGGHIHSKGEYQEKYDMLIQKYPGDENEPIDNENNINRIKQLVENNNDFKEIKAITNTQYSIYSLTKRVGITTGKLTKDLRDYLIEFNQSIEDGFFINGNYNHMPRPVTVYTNLEKKGDALQIKDYKNYYKKSIIKPLQNLIGDREPIVVQYIECDINGDNKMEKIVHLNNGITKDYNDLENEGNTKGFKSLEKYYAIIAVLDQNNKIIDYIHNIPNLKFSDVPSFIESSSEQRCPQIQYIVDTNQDNIMEIVVYYPGYEWYQVKYYGLSNGKFTSWLYDYCM